MLDSNLNNDDEAAKRSRSGIPWQPVAGSVFGVALVAAILGSSMAFAGVNDWAYLFATILGVLAIAITVYIAIIQAIESAKDREILEDLHRVERMQERSQAEFDYGANGALPAGDSSGELEAGGGGQGRAMPDLEFQEQARVVLRSKGAKLDLDNLQWLRKGPSTPTRGNHGWYVTSEGVNERWFLRRANGMTARRALPKDYLEAFVRETELTLDDIRLDFQEKDHGLAAWFVETYSGQTWKISRSNRSLASGFRVTRIEDSDLRP